MPQATTKKNKGKISNVRVTVGCATIQKIENWNDVKVVGSSCGEKKRGRCAVVATPVEK
jgi:hypothetical protein